VPIVNATLFRSLSLRGLLAVTAAVLVRCSPEVAQCIALPGSSIFLSPPRDDLHLRVDDAMARTWQALQGRAALDAARQTALAALP